MNVLEFRQFPLWLNLATLAVASAVVWFAGTRLTRDAKTISDRTRAGQAFIGMLLLGGVVSLPEAATAMTAAVAGNARFAVNTLLGGVAATMVALAVVDLAVVQEPLSTDITRPVVLLQGALATLLLLVTAAAVVLGDVAFMGVGVGSGVILALYLVIIFHIREHQAEEPWVAGEATDGDVGASPRRHPPEQPQRVRAGERPLSRGPEAQDDGFDDGVSTGRIILQTVASGIAILIAGIVLARSGDAIAAQTGLGASFVGLLLGGIVTSLPEVSTAAAAARLRQYELVFSDAFGSNIFSVMLIFFVDVFYSGDPVLNEVGRFGLFATLLGALVTVVYLTGIVERRNRVVLRMGIDSLLVLALYTGGLVALYHLR